MHAVFGDPGYRDVHATCATTVMPPPGHRRRRALERLVYEYAGGTCVPGKGVGK